ncbi:hypothetical protein CBL_01551 [Carabus blaptoides fortunei]
MRAFQVCLLVVAATGLSSAGSAPEKKHAKRGLIGLDGNGIFCYTLEQWCLRMGFSNLFGFLALSIVLFYLSFQVENTEDIDSQTIFIVLGVIFLIPAIFALILLIGIFSKKLPLIFIWLIYSTICNTCFAVIMLGGGIFYMATIEVGPGVLYLFLMLLADAGLWYGTLVVRSLYLDYKEAKVAKSLEMGQEYH